MSQIKIFAKLDAKAKVWTKISENSEDKANKNMPKYAKYSKVLVSCHETLLKNVLTLKYKTFK